jgi:endonuclease/exonuclease/phosphatase family metal-dependent hydrolase
MNYKRNAGQLRFLEWYITGSTDFKVKLKNIKTLNVNDYFIAMGDFNVLLHAKNEGATVLNRILNKTNPWIDKSSMTFTNEAQNFSKNPKRLMLDYIATSRSITPLNGRIHHPQFDRNELGCESKKLIPQNNKNDMIEVKYLHNETRCSVLVKKKYKQLKEASDHYPLYGEFEIK